MEVNTKVDPENHTFDIDELERLMDWFAPSYPSDFVYDTPLFFAGHLLPGANGPLFTECTDDIERLFVLQRLKAVTQIIEPTLDPRFNFRRWNRVTRFDEFIPKEWRSMIKYDNLDVSEEVYWAWYDASIYRALEDLDYTAIADRYSDQLGSMKIPKCPPTNKETFRKKKWKQEVHLIVPGILQCPVPQVAQYLFWRLCASYPVMKKLSECEGHEIQKWKISFDTVQPHYCLPFMALKFVYTLDTYYYDIIYESLPE